MSRFRNNACLLLALCLDQLSGWAQVESVSALESRNIREDRIYLFSRGTRSKAYLLARGFNIADTNSTHIGIGYYKNDQFYIYNVVDERPPGESALVVNSLNSFLSNPEVFYFSLWEVRSDRSAVLQMREVLRNYEQTKITFDVQFQIQGNDTLYCSEFCALVLNRIIGSGVDFKPSTKPLANPLFEAVLNRKAIRYYPVDFFQSSDRVRKIYEWIRE